MLQQKFCISIVTCENSSIQNYNYIVYLGSWWFGRENLAKRKRKLWLVLLGRKSQLWETKHNFFKNYGRCHRFSDDSIGFDSASQKVFQQVMLYWTTCCVGWICKKLPSIFGISSNSWKVLGQQFEPFQIEFYYVLKYARVRL